MKICFLKVFIGHKGVVAVRFDPVLDIRYLTAIGPLKLPRMFAGVCEHEKYPIEWFVQIPTSAGTSESIREQLDSARRDRFHRLSIDEF
ncbi:Hypothetical protein NTJ_06751 [Nesidiocoris tenuis]|uniref:Uncharacterized protein n=1 Tax=Nesidiocoris tenuis TaxID=355587 RepID=A0ABN7ANZ1_9HEMI|nr:Hypothetical protein NTJ_06751 [Nesidiocoris tenuis]